MIERRFESRFLCADLVKVDWLAGGNSRNVEAVLEDISALGACVQVEECIPAGTEISILVSAKPVGLEEAKSARFTGYVSYCVFRDYGYFAGIRFSGETRWSSGVVEPQHLTNLQTLTSK
jgi:hypothetical protein